MNAPKILKPIDTTFLPVFNVVSAHKYNMIEFVMELSPLFTKNIAKIQLFNELNSWQKNRTLK